MNFLRCWSINFFTLVSFLFRKKEHRMLWISYYFTFIKGSMSGCNICIVRNPNAYQNLVWCKIVWLGVIHSILFSFFFSLMGRGKEGWGGRKQLEEKARDWSMVNKIKQLLQKITTSESREWVSNQTCQNHS